MYATQRQKIFQYKITIRKHHWAPLYQLVLNVRHSWNIINFVVVVEKIENKIIRMGAFS